MAINPFGSGKAVLSKSPSEGKTIFSNGKATAEIVAWEVWNSRVKRNYSAYSKVYNDQTTLVVRTHDPIAEELECDDGLMWNGYTYSIQEVRPVKTAYSARSFDYEILLG